MTTEAQLQSRVLDVAAFAGFLVFHDYDSRRNRPGFPDLCLVHKRTGRLIFIELKSDKGKVRPEQKEWLAALAKRHEAYLWRPNDWSTGVIQRVLLGRRVAERAMIGA